MADEPEDVLELDEAIEGEEPEIDEDGDGNEPGVADEEDGSDDEDEPLYTFGDEDEAAPASGERDTGLVRHLREQLRERDKRLAELQKAAPVQQPIEVGPRPTLADFDFDEEKFEIGLDAWKADKAKAEQQQADAEKAREESNKAWAEDVQRWQQDRATIPFGDVDDAEAAVTTVLDQTQQAVIVKAADAPAKLIYALGKRPDLLTELSKISDPLKLAARVAKLEGTLKVTTRRKAPPPEQIAKGSGSSAVGKDKTLERLEAEAEKTGDRTKLIAHRRKLREQGK